MKLRYVCRIINKTPVVLARRVDKYLSYKVMNILLCAREIYEYAGMSEDDIYSL